MIVTIPAVIYSLKRNWGGGDMEVENFIQLYNRYDILYLELI